MGKSELLIRKIDGICDSEIDSYYKIILIKKIINDWREDDD